MGINRRNVIKRHMRHAVHRSSSLRDSPCHIRAVIVRSCVKPRSLSARPRMSIFQEYHSPQARSNELFVNGDGERWKSLTGKGSFPRVSPTIHVYPCAPPLSLSNGLRGISLRGFASWREVSSRVFPCAPWSTKSSWCFVVLRGWEMCAATRRLCVLCVSVVK